MIYLNFKVPDSLPRKKWQVGTKTKGRIYVAWTTLSSAVYLNNPLGR